MGKISLSVVMLTASLFVIGCSSTKCRRYHDLSDASKTKWVAEDKGATARVFVFKEDGSRQCGMGQAVRPEVMQKELEGIEVFSSDNRSDGMMHIQACGAPTGRINVYEIRQVDLDRALKKGFRSLQN